MHDAVVEAAVAAYPVERHQPWCDRQQHALAFADTIGPTGCVSRYIQHGTVGGWITEEVPPQGSGVRFVVDWRPGEGWSSLSLEEAAELSGFLADLLVQYRRPAAPRLLAWSRRQPA